MVRKWFVGCFGGLIFLVISFVGVVVVDDGLGLVSGDR